MPVVVLFLIFVALLVIAGIDYPWNHICASVGV